MTFLFCEFYTPFNQFVEPVSLIAVELAFWDVVSLAETSAIAGTAEKLCRS